MEFKSIMLIGMDNMQLNGVDLRIMPCFGKVFEGEGPVISGSLLRKA